MWAGAILLAWTLGEELVLDLPAKTGTDWFTDVVYVGAGTAIDPPLVAWRHRQ